MTTPKPGQIWERDGVQRTIIAVSGIGFIYRVRYLALVNGHLPNWYEHEYECGYRTWERWARRAKIKDLQLRQLPEVTHAPSE